MLRLCIFLVAAVILTCAGRAQRVAAASASPAQRQVQYAELIQTVRPPDPTGKPQKAPPIKWAAPSRERQSEVAQQLHELCAATVIDGLEEADSTAESVQESLRTLQGKHSLVASIERRSNVPSVAITEINGLPVAIAAFSVLYGGYGIPNTDAAIQFLSKAGGAWEVRDEVGDFFDGAYFRTALLNAPTPSEAWLLAWGTIFGNTRGMLRARLYAFDGYSARVVWEVERLQVGFIEVPSGDEIELRYYQPPPEGVRIPPTKVVERWRVVPSGLQKVVE